MKYYGVSTGDGNTGVRHCCPDYIVETDDPWTLAEVACVESFNDEYRKWAERNVEVDSEEGGIISATLRSYGETEFAHFILKVFPSKT
jgi:hypothetical protein